MRIADDAVPSPGSDEALDRGCTCAVLDNAHGRGFPLSDGTTGYWITEGCPVHSNDQDK